MAEDLGLRLTHVGGRPPVASLESVNDALAPFGARVRPLDVGAAPAEIRRLLVRPSLSESEAARVRERFLLPRERLLEIVAEAGRAPHVPDGGALETFVETYGYGYPVLYQVEPGVDYGRFDRFHVNLAADGTGVDEVMQVLCGGGVVVRQRRPGLGEAALRLDCPDKDTGWILTYDGGAPHIGSLSSAAPGTKVLMQVIGPPRWAVRYEDDA